MRFCMPHWTALRDEIENKRGLEQFVSHSGKELVSWIVEGGEDPLGADLGDPLMTAHNMILSNAMKLLEDNGYNPLVLFAGDDCPLCVVSRCGNPDCKNNCAARAAEWIEFAGRDVAEMWAARLQEKTQ